MVEAIIIVLICVIVSGLIFLVIEYNKLRDINKYKMSFKESMDLAELPVVTFYQKDKKFNFLLDTGSNDSIISKSASRHLKGTYVNCNHCIDGLGSTNVTKACTTTLQYKDTEFEAEFLVSEGVADTFNSIKRSCGVQIHGILGTKFFQKYKYILDFNELIAYKK